MNHIFYLKSATERLPILGLDVCRLTYADALSFANEMASLPIGQTIISFLNANNANLMAEDEDYRRVLARHVVFPDGIGIDIAASLVHGAKFPANLNGTDFVPAMLTYMSRPKRIGLIGARRDVVEKAAENFKRHAPWHEFIVVSDGYFDHANPAKITAALEMLNLDILLVAMGSPLQEKWIDQHIKPSHARLVLSVGALFDFVGAEVPRAPAIMRKFRLEWLFRLAIEPKRLWKRYILGNPLFLLRVLNQAFRTRVLRKPTANRRGLDTLG